MYSIFMGSLLISLLHAIIPNHWLPVLAIGKKEGWGNDQLIKVPIRRMLTLALLHGISSPPPDFTKTVFHNSNYLSEKTTFAVQTFKNQLKQ